MEDDTPSKAELQASLSSCRKTRLSFELHPSLIMEDMMEELFADEDLVGDVDDSDAADKDFLEDLDVLMNLIYKR